VTLRTHGLSTLIALLRKKEISPLDVAEDLLSAIDERNGELNAYLDVFADDVRSEARRLAGTGSFLDLPLGGIPLAVKNNICVGGKRTTCGSRMLQNYRSPYHATVIHRLLDCGASMLGSTNMDEFGMGSSTENSAFGPTRHPSHADRVPGGSSGGSAAAVAAGIAPAALGSDTGGSIRQPAAFCGVVGMKPTYGRISRYGLVAFASSFDQIGPITRNVEDCALLMDVMCGHDARDATSLPDAPLDCMKAIPQGLAGLRIGVPRDFVDSCEHPVVRGNYEAVLAELRARDIPVQEVSLPHARYAVACYYIIANAEAGANLARYDGVRYGYRAEKANNIYEMYARTRGEGFGEEVKRRILLGTYVLSEGYHDAYYLQAQKVRSLLRKDFDEVFGKCDLLVTPTTPTPAFRLGEKVDDPLSMYLSDVFTVPANLAGLPAISIPSGLSEEGLPLGIQLIGRRKHDEQVVRGAYGLERIIGFDRRKHSGIGKY
jgi:aspartyl-tRNA(Asn)/glutamyl-tRNA(Gln) amidotransferase subunit A